ncbi:TPA: hypothetical protein DDZ86_03175 [Candidatus Dependentiae bacterium]|nr:MAG: hypothetical protein UW09_C0001G0013 [candidate division TM6 bacterium GW2011_GWF2_43_87]HBL98618.1 hypothetical protein [Candidatus Dependentiae bacterium]
MEVSTMTISFNAPFKGMLCAALLMVGMVPCALHAMQQPNGGMPTQQQIFAQFKNIANDKQKLTQFFINEMGIPQGAQLNQLVTRYFKKPKALMTFLQQHAMNAQQGQNPGAGMAPQPAPVKRQLPPRKMLSWKVRTGAEWVCNDVEMTQHIEDSAKAFKNYLWYFRAVRPAAGVVGVGALALAGYYHYTKWFGQQDSNQSLLDEVMQLRERIGLLEGTAQPTSGQPWYMNLGRSVGSMAWGMASSALGNFVFSQVASIPVSYAQKHYPFGEILESTPSLKWYVENKTQFNLCVRTVNSKLAEMEWVMSSWFDDYDNRKKIKVDIDFLDREIVSLEQTVTTLNAMQVRTPQQERQRTVALQKLVSRKQKKAELQLDFNSLNLAAHSVQHNYRLRCADLLAGLQRLFRESERVLGYMLCNKEDNGSDINLQQKYIDHSKKITQCLVCLMRQYNYGSLETVHEAVKQLMDIVLPPEEAQDAGMFGGIGSLLGGLLPQGSRDYMGGV